MGSLNDFAKAQEQTIEEVEIKPRKKGMKSYGVFLFQLAFTMLFVVAAFFIVYSENSSTIGVASYLREGLSMENSWLFPEQVQPVESNETLYRPPCSGDIKKAMVKNSEGGLDVAGFAIAGQKGESVYPITAGTVSVIADNEGIFALQINHDADMYTVYSGLAEVSVKEGDSVQAETVLGSLGEDGLLFAVYMNGAPVDPTALFGQIKN